GHAIETLTGYKKISHGEAVGIGMAIAGKISNKMGMLVDEELEKQNDLIKRTGLTIILHDIDPKSVLRELSKDKKAVGGKPEFVLLEKIGKAKFNIRVPDNIILDALS
ncbi:MAG: 3-dehydroquinate synthase, partial [Nanoarchaeota archaeon]